MASTSTPMPTEALVTIKINYDGQTKRCKLPLRDMGATTLEDRLREFLEVPSDRLYKFERYSDSAGTYVVLDKNNVSVFKQLYRAAKAKSKLKIRVTDVTPAVAEDEKHEQQEEKVEEEKCAPQPVTVEDDTEEPEQPEPTTTSTSTPTSSDGQKMHEASPEVQAEPKTSLIEMDGADTVQPSTCLDNLDLPYLQQPCLQSAADSVTNRQATCPARPWGEFRVCCNNCDATIPDAHYHCTTCDNDDFDLCLNCVDKGVTCYDSSHWLIRRFKKDGVFVSSTTERIPPKPKSQLPVRPRSPAQLPTQSTFNGVVPRVVPEQNFPLFSTRTCNCCVQDLPDSQFLHCTVCEDYDLCVTCFDKNGHGHHPSHSFVPVAKSAMLPSYIRARLGPGRNQSHSAICDGCDKYVRGVRHKCLDCPDWDYCNDCIVNAKIIHPAHRFVPIYEPLAEIRPRQSTRPVHVGICCDGPLCARPKRRSYITGIRYKCAVCHDTDFCANCEASPANGHNKTHPLIKFKTAVRHVTVTTSGDRGNGKLLQLGDRYAPPRTNSRATETASRQVSMNSVQTVVNVEPTEPTLAPEASSVAAKDAEPTVAELVVAEKQETVEIKDIVEEEVKEEIEEDVNVEAKEEEKEIQPELVVAEAEKEKVDATPDLGAMYICDTVTDGTVLPPNHVFEQTWVLRNTGKVAWPAGCSVKFVGGDYMGHVDSNHPAGISDLVATSESTVCYPALEPGMDYPFTVLLRTPSREGKIISYWRLTTREGIKFGHRLWCDVTVQAPKVKEEIAAAAVEKETSAAPEQADSQMIFPKLEKESPVSSMHEDTAPAKAEGADTQEREEDGDDFDDCEEWDASDDGFVTDEEYDILDASDEEYLEQQHSRSQK